MTLVERLGTFDWCARWWHTAVLYYHHIRLLDAERSGNTEAAVDAATRIIQMGGKVK